MCWYKIGRWEVKRLGLDNVAGIFLVTTVGCIIAGVFAVLEFLYGTKQSAQDSGVTWFQEMANELKFIFLCHGNTKEVGGGSDSDSSSSSTLSSLEARRKCEAKEKGGGGRAQSSNARNASNPDPPPVQNTFGSKPDSPFQNPQYTSSRGLFGHHRGNNGSYIGRHQGEPVYGVPASLKSNTSEHSERKTPSSMSSAVEEEEERSNSGNNNTAAARKFSPGNNNSGNNSGNNNAAAGTKYSSGNRNFFNPHEKQRGSRGNPFESVNI